MVNFPFSYPLTGTPVVIDGDTVKVELDLGFSLYHKVNIRLAGLNAPEVNTTEGQAVRSSVSAWVLAHTTTQNHWRAITYKSGQDKYGRYLATVIAPNGEELNAWLLDSGQAKSWDGEGPKPV